jgi:hypothetical protein
MAFRICLPSIATITGLGASNRARSGFQIGVFTELLGSSIPQPGLGLAWDTGMRPQPWTGLGIIVNEELGGVFCTLGYIILQDSLFLGEFANMIFQNQVLKCFPCSPDDGDYRPPILVKLFFEIYSFESVQWTRVMGEYFVP